MAVQTLPDLQESLRNRDLTKLRESIKNWPPPDLAELLDDVSVEDEVVLFLVLPRKLAAETFAYLTPEQQERLLKAMAQEEVIAILNEMPDDDRTLLLDEMPASATKQM